MRLISSFLAHFLIEFLFLFCIITIDKALCNVRIRNSQNFDKKVTVDKII